MELLLHLIRHGQASVLEDDYDQLQPLGELQARLLGEHLREREQGFVALYVGPLRRQLETMRLLREGAGTHAAAWPEPIVLDELAEGPFELLMKRHLRIRLTSDTLLQPIAARYRAATDAAARDAALNDLFEHMVELWERAEVRGADLEAADVFAARIARGIERIAAGVAGGGEVGVVTSSGVITRLLQRGGYQPPPGERFRVHNASVSLLQLAAGEWLARSCNSIEHLHKSEYQTLL